MNRESPGHRRAYKYYDLVMASFVTVLLCANLIGASKVSEVWGFTLGAGVLFFPISHIFGDVLTDPARVARQLPAPGPGYPRDSLGGSPPPTPTSRVN